MLLDVNNLTGVEIDKYKKYSSVCGIMSDLEHRFYQPGVISFYPGLVESLHEEGTDLAMRLDTGDESLLPDAVEGWLTLHSVAVNGKAPGTMRGRIAEEIDQPPYDYEKARRVGALIRDTITVTSDFGVRLGEAQRRIQERWDKGDTNS